MKEIPSIQQSPCWIILEEELPNLIKQGKDFFWYSPYSYFRIIKPLDNNQLQGYLGHSDLSGKFHSTINTTYNYFSEFERGKQVYLSFDKITLFQVSSIIQTNPLTFILDYLGSPSIINRQIELQHIEIKKNMQQFKLETKEFDVALSFAGEDRNYVKKVARILINKKVRVFYDEYEVVDLWGKDLYQHLNNIYKNKSRFCVIFISKYYAEKLWTRHELESAQARAFEENREYILPVRFDNTKLPGINATTGYIDLKNKPPEELAELIISKVNSVLEKSPV